MTMVYKLMGEIPNENRNIFINKIKENFKYIYKNGIFYIALLNYQKSFDLCGGIKGNDRYDKTKTSENVDTWLSCLFHDYCKDSMIKIKITENNIMNEDADIKDWLRDNLVALDKQRYEFEQQEKLKATWKAMDYMEQFLYEEKVNKYNQAIKNSKSKTTNNKTNSKLNVNKNS